MSILFNQDYDIQQLNFSAVFIHQAYYTELLRLCNTYFNLNMLDPDKRELPLPKFTYMLIRKDTSNKQQLFLNVGIHTRMNITKLIYNKKFGILVAAVQLKKNWTCNTIPHIVLAKKHNVTNDFINLVINGGFTHFEGNNVIDIDDPFSIKGRIGVMTNSTIEDPYVETTIEGGVRVETSSEVVERPEVSISISRAPCIRIDKTADFTFDKLVSEDNEDNDQEKKKNGLGTYKGYPIKQGPRGGKYYIDGSGKRIYMTGSSAYGGKETTADSSSKLIYKINMVNDKTK